jgi:hypothetical protein
MTHGWFGGVALVALLSGAAAAHHSIAGVYDTNSSVTVEGAVASFHFVNPHPYLDIHVPAADGQTQAWRLELDTLNELRAVGMRADTLKPGDAVVVTGSRARDKSRSIYVRSLHRQVDGFLYEQVGFSPRVRFGAR